MIAKEKETVFLTGSTGLVGSYLAKILLENGHKIYTLARSNKQGSAKKRVLESISFWMGKKKNIFDDLEIIDGDIIYKNLGVRKKNTLDDIIKNVDIIFHSAALARLTVPLNEIRKVNVEGTKNVLDFAARCLKEGKLKKINYISTAYIVGDINNVKFSEDMLDIGQKFHNTYEQSKFEAEILVRKYLTKGLDISIFRPSMIMGETGTGKINNFLLFYEPLDFFSRGIFEQFPVDEDSHQNLINIDTVAKILYELRMKNGFRVFHIVSDNNLNVRKFLGIASKYLNFKLPKLYDQKKFNYSYWTKTQKNLAAPFLPYFNQRVKFSNSYIKKEIGSLNKFCLKIDRGNIINILNYFKKEKYESK